MTDANSISLTDAQAITVAGSVGVTLLCVIENLMPPHRRVARKIKGVQDAVLELFRDSGQKVDPAITEWVLKCWDKAVCLAEELPGTQQPPQIARNHRGMWDATDRND